MGLEDLIILAGADLKTALSAIDRNGQGMVFVTDSQKALLGVLTDGDIRRALLNGRTLENPADEVMNSNYMALPVESDDLLILKNLSEKIRIIPLVDKDHRLVDYASMSKIRRIAVASPLLSGNELIYVTDCIKTNWISSQGKYVRKFEEQFSCHFDNQPALAVSNGTVALHLALEALKVGPGDEVIVPDLTFAASVNAILYAGATPVLADIDPVSWNIDPKNLEALVTSRTRAIMPVHLYGLPCDMDAIMRFARKHCLLVIEDCAEALGSYYNNMPVGCFGDVATFSFYGNKTITTGEGGMVVFKNSLVAERAEMLRDHGMSKSRRYWHEEVGYNYRMTNIQAAIGVAQFERLDEFVQAKQSIAAHYNESLRNLGCFQLPHEHESLSNSYWLYTMLVTAEAPFSRDDLLAYLQTCGVESRPVFYPMHEMPPYQSFGAKLRSGVSASVSRRGISLPSSVNLTSVELEYICKSIQRYVKHKVVTEFS